MTDLYLAARRYVGVPFEHRGRTPDRSLDCLGLVRQAAEDMGMDVEGVPADYSRRPHDGLLESYVERYLGKPVRIEPIRMEDLLPNDVVVMHFDHARVSRGLPSSWPVCHIGIVGEFQGRLTLIHTDGRVGRKDGSRKAGKVVEHSIDAATLASIAAVYRA